MTNDELKIYRGDEIVVSDHIKIRQPTLGDICDLGENDYFSSVYTLTATPQSLKVQLFDMGVDYMEITPYQLFYSLLYKMLPQEKTSILFGDLDFSKFEAVEKEDGSIILCQDILVPNKEDSQGGKRWFWKKKLPRFYHTETIVIDEYTYNVIVKYLCDIHFIERDLKIPANNSTKKILIEDAREEMERQKNEPHHSQLKNLISSMVNCEGFKYNHAEVWSMKINAFMDSVKRVSKIKDATLLLQSGYSGYGISLKDISKKQLNWLGDLE